MTSSKTLLTVLIIFLMNLLACVSVNLPTSSKGTPAKGIVYKEPGHGFDPITEKYGDKTWKNRKTNNLISVLSECGGNDPSLESLQSELESAMQETDNQESKKLMFNDREALWSEVTGKIDGIPVKLASMIFKKNACNYVITLSGQSKNFEADKNTFQDFLKEFKAP